MQKFQGALGRFVRDEEAATAAEYGLIAALIAGFLFAALNLLGGSLGTLFGNMKNKVDTAAAK